MAYQSNNSAATTQGQNEKHYSFCEVAPLLVVTQAGVDNFLNNRDHSVDAAKFFFNTKQKGTKGIRQLSITCIGTVVRPDTAVKAIPTGGGVIHFDMPLDNVSKKMARYFDHEPDCQGDTTWIHWSAFDYKQSTLATRFANFLARHPNEKVMILATGTVEQTETEKNGKVYRNCNAVLSNFRLWPTGRQGAGATQTAASAANGGRTYGYAPQTQSAQQQAPQAPFGYTAAPSPAPYDGDDGWGPEEIDEVGELPF